MQPFMTFVSKYLQKCTSFYLLLLRNLSWHCAHSKNTTSFNVSSTLFSTPFVLFSCTPFGTKSYIYAESDFPHLIWFCSSKEGPDHIVQNQPGSNLAKLTWSGSKPVWKNLWAWFWQNATGLLPVSVSHFQTW